MEQNIHNFHNVSRVSSVEEKNSNLFFIIAISALLIGGELLWSQIRDTNYDIDSYSANVYSALSRRESLDIAKLSAEVMNDEGADAEESFESVDRLIESL
jgi:hypothetical protein